MFRVTLGDFDVAPIHDSNPAYCAVFFFLFVVFVYFVILCMFLAIINHAYFMVKELSIKYGHQLTLGGYIFAVGLGLYCRGL